MSESLKAPRKRKSTRKPKYTVADLRATLDSAKFRGSMLMAISGG
jgi:hypothetical protein